MAIEYTKLFHLLLDLKMKESEFRDKVNISAPTLGKLRRNEIITTEIINRICAALDVQPADIMEYIPTPTDKIIQ